MHTKERSDTKTEMLKQVSMSRTLLAAKKTAALGMLRKRSLSTKVPYTRELRVKSD